MHILAIVFRFFPCSQETRRRKRFLFEVCFGWSLDEKISVTIVLQKVKDNASEPRGKDMKKLGEEEKKIFFIGIVRTAVCVCHRCTIYKSPQSTQFDRFALSYMQFFFPFIIK